MCTIMLAECTMTSEASKSISPLGARLYEAIEGEVRRKKDLNQIPLTLMLAELHKLLPAPWDEVRKALVELVGLNLIRYGRTVNSYYVALTIGI